MARRRRKGNPLLARIVLISVAVHIVALPLLAYFGAFKKIQRAINGPEVIFMPPPPQERQRPEVKKKAESKKITQKTAAAPSAARRSAQAKGTPLQQHVVAANVPGGSGSGGGTVINPDKGAPPGVLPVGPGPGSANPRANVNDAPPKHAPEPAPKPTPKPAPKLEEKAVEKIHVPVATDVAATYNPSPEIPEDLKSEVLEATVVAQFVVGVDGVPTRVQISRSSGNTELDRIALETARRWRFKPATRDGQPIESRVNLHIDFEVQ